jgi:hypothetical protein
VGSDIKLYEAPVENKHPQICAELAETTGVHPALMSEFCVLRVILTDSLIHQSAYCATINPSAL